MNKYFPTNLEIQFYKLWKNKLYSIVDGIIKIFNREFRDDVTIDSVDSIQNEIETLVNDRLKELTPAIQQWGGSLVAFSNVAFSKKILEVLPLKFKRKYTIETIKLIINKPQVQNTLTEFYYSNKIYSDQIKNELLQKTLPLSIKTVEQGASMKTLKEELKTFYQWSDKKATLHAQTSVANVLGAVDRQHFVANKLEEYIWSSSNDERVRASHRSLNGTRRKLGEGIEPASEFRCRCTKLPVQEEVMKSLFPES